MVSLNVKQSLSMTASIRRPITQAARNKSRALKAPHIPSQALAVNSVSQGFNIPSFASASNVSTSPINHHTSSLFLPLSNNSNAPAQKFGSTSSEPGPSSSALSTLFTPPTDPQGAREVAAVLSRKCVAEELISSRPQKKERKTRTCQKCGRPECPGKQRVANCKNPCQDCGRIDCEDRNPKLRGDISCDKAWKRKQQ